LSPSVSFGGGEKYLAQAVSSNTKVRIRSLDTEKPGSVGEVPVFIIKNMIGVELFCLIMDNGGARK
jgi:hypothetical protein